MCKMAFINDGSIWIFVYYIELGKKSLPFDCKYARINAVFRVALPEDIHRNAT